MRKIDEPETMPPAEIETSHGVSVRLSPCYKNGPGLPSSILLSLIDLPLEVTPADHVEGDWDSHAEAFKVAAESAERWVLALIKRGTILVS